MTTVWRLQGRRTDMYRDSDSDKRYVERMRKEKVGDDSNTSVTLGLSRHRQCVSLPCSPAPPPKTNKTRAPNLRRPKYHGWFFPHSDSVSVRHVFIKIERIINKTTKSRNKNIYGKLLLAHISFQTINMLSTEKKNPHVYTHPHAHTRTHARNFLVQSV